MTTKFDCSETVLYLRLPNWIGDLCMCLPLLHELMRRNVRIVVCAEPWAKALLSAYEFEGWINITGKIREDAATIRAHKKQHQHYKTVGLIIPDSLSSALVFRLAGIPSAGYKDEGRSVILKWAYTKPIVPMHAVEFWYNLARQAANTWGLPFAPEPDQHLDLQLREQAYEQSNQTLAEADLSEGGFVLIAPTAKGLHKGQNKTWSQYAELHDALSQQGIRVVMCPPPNELAIAKTAAPATEILPSLPLDAFAALCKKAGLVVCNDSGVSHLAAAVNASQLSLFGVSTTLRTRPWSSKAHTLGEVGQWPSVDAVISRSIELVEKTKVVA